MYAYYFWAEGFRTKVSSAGAWRFGTKNPTAASSIRRTKDDNRIIASSQPATKCGLEPMDMTQSSDACRERRLQVFRGVLAWPAVRNRRSQNASSLNSRCSNRRLCSCRLSSPVHRGAQVHAHEILCVVNNHSLLARGRGYLSPPQGACH